MERWDVFLWNTMLQWIEGTEDDTVFLWSNLAAKTWPQGVEYTSVLSEGWSAFPPSAETPWTRHWGAVPQEGWLVLPAGWVLQPSQRAQALQGWRISLSWIQQHGNAWVTSRIRFVCSHWWCCIYCQIKDQLFQLTCVGIQTTAGLAMKVWGNEGIKYLSIFLTLCLCVPLHPLKMSYSLALLL